MCKYLTWYWLNQETGEVAPFCCGSWNCQVHQKEVAFRWAVKVAQSRPERMITLTNIPKDKERAYLGFKQLIRDIRSDGMELEYCRFMEVGQKTGMYHFHMAQRGSFIPQAYLSNRAAANGLGEVVDIRRCRQKGPEWYLAKYITKDGVPPHWRKVASSRGYFVREELEEPKEPWILVKAERGLYTPSKVLYVPSGALERAAEAEEVSPSAVIAMMAVLALFALCQKYVKENLLAVDSS